MTADGRDRVECVLRVQSWVGIVAWAKHWEGYLQCDGAVKPVEYILTPSQAKKLTLHDNKVSLLGPIYNWEAGSPSTRFWSEKALIKHAKKVWRDLFPQATVLTREFKVIDTKEAP